MWYVGVDASPNCICVAAVLFCHTTVPFCITNNKTKLGYTCSPKVLKCGFFHSSPKKNHGLTAWSDVDIKTSIMYVHELQHHENTDKQEIAKLLLNKVDKLTGDAKVHYSLEKPLGYDVNVSTEQIVFTKDIYTLMQSRYGTVIQHDHKNTIPALNRNNISKARKFCIVYVEGSGINITGNGTVTIEPASSYTYTLIPEKYTQPQKGNVVVTEDTADTIDCTVYAYDVQPDDTSQTSDTIQLHELYHVNTVSRMSTEGHTTEMVRDKKHPGVYYCIIEVNTAVLVALASGTFRIYPVETIENNYVNIFSTERHVAESKTDNIISITPIAGTFLNNERTIDSFETFTGYKMPGNAKGKPKDHPNSDIVDSFSVALFSRLDHLYRPGK